jgi:oligopeptide/dipeptide ABC transporter ATP-binding protein
MTLLKLYEPTSGKIFFSNRDISEIKRKGHLKEFRKNAQIVFQNPYESINPRFTVFQWVEEPLRIHYTDRKGEHVHMVLHALERAGLFPAHFFLDRYPHELSGGQLQRIAIARAIAVEPSLLIADEPVSMLDVSIRAGILNLLKQFCTESNMAILYISHDLSTMKHICTSVAIMYMGRIVEMGDSQQVLNAPQHPYARALVAAIPQMKSKLGRKRVLLEGAVPNPIHLPTGCRFHPRCPEVKPICREEEPELLVLEDRCQVACHVIRL